MDIRLLVFIFIKTWKKNRGGVCFLRCPTLFFHVINYLGLFMFLHVFVILFFFCRISEESAKFPNKVLPDINQDADV